MGCRDCGGCLENIARINCRPTWYSKIFKSIRILFIRINKNTPGNNKQVTIRIRIVFGQQWLFGLNSDWSSVRTKAVFQNSILRPLKFHFETRISTLLHLYIIKVWLICIKPWQILTNCQALFRLPPFLCQTCSELLSVGISLLCADFTLISIEVIQTSRPIISVKYVVLFTVGITWTATSEKRNQGSCDPNFK